MATHISLHHTAAGVCLRTENNRNSPTTSKVFRAQGPLSVESDANSAILGEHSLNSCSRKGLKFEKKKKKLLAVHAISANDSNGGVSGREKPWKRSSERPSRTEDFGGAADRALRPEEDTVPGRDVPPVFESPGERYLRIALGIQDSKNQKNDWEDEDRPRDSRKGGRKLEETPKKTDELSKKEKKMKKSSVPVINNLNHNHPSCYGCGAVLQTQESEAPGYIPPQTYEVKKKHHQLRSLLCGRCRLLSQGHMIPAVGGLGGYGSGKGFVLAEELRSQLSHLRHQKALIVKLVDIVDFNGSFLTRVRDLVGANPIIMVLTKCDLLPEGTDLAAVSDWLQEATMRKKLNVISIHLTSSKAKTGITRVAAEIARQRLGRDVYVLGSANVGKSAFVTAVLQEMAKRDPAAAAGLRRKPIQSAMPGTTLGAIEFEAFSGSGKLFDTPGVHLHHRMAAVVDPKDVALLAPRRRLRGYVIGPRGREEEALEMEPEEDSHLFDEGFLDSYLEQKLASGKGIGRSSPVDGELDELDDDEGLWAEGSLSGTSLFWGGVVRIDVVKGPADLKLTFFGPSAIRIRKCPIEEADEFYEENLGSALTPPTASNVENWGGLGKVQDIIFDVEEGTSRPLGDIAISGLGWITIGRAAVEDEEDTGEKADNEDMKNSSSSFAYAETEADGDDEESEPSAEAIELILHTPKAVEVFVRPSIPLGKSATRWYEYEELDDAELAARPTVNY
ncbi:hypothetical protein R1sor_003292 [Riccia sorocarpa]|uniref:CP-type G domain-containing protein n=1 Tax=Riccia sorocarpa TaxID=122646 RepID=A0ABD3H4K1_9MARC